MHDTAATASPAHSSTEPTPAGATRQSMSPMQSFHNKLKGERVTIIVGKDDGKTAFEFPKALLCSRSEWFEKAFREDRFVEGRAGAMTLPDDPPTAFMAFEYYLYHGDLGFEALHLDSRPQANAMGFANEIHELVETWVLGDKYDMPGMQDCAMLRVCEILKHDQCHWKVIIKNETLALCFQRTMPKSPLRKLAGDYVVWCLEDTGDDFSHFQELFELEGFFQAVYLSKDDYHRLPYPNFPRYLKPAKNPHHFRVTRPGSEPSDTASGFNASTARWSCPSNCEDCGLRIGRLRCDHCREIVSDTGCSCHSRGRNVICGLCFDGSRDEEGDDGSMEDE